MMMTMRLPFASSSGAVAITAVLGGDAVHRLDSIFFVSRAINSILLLLIAVLFNPSDWKAIIRLVHISMNALKTQPTQKSDSTKDIEYALGKSTSCWILANTI